MLCERLAGRTRILLKQKEKQEDFVKYLPVFLKQTIDCIIIGQTYIVLQSVVKPAIS